MKKAAVRPTGLVSDRYSHRDVNLQQTNELTRTGAYRRKNTDSALSDIV